MRTKLREIKEVLRRRRHEPIADQGRWLGQVVRGWFNYHAAPTNAFALRSFRAAAGWLWRQAVRRCGDRKRIRWRRFGRLADRWVPKPRILHPWPSQRVAVTHPRWEPDALIGHVRFCAGGAQ